MTDAFTTDNTQPKPEAEASGLPASTTLSTTGEENLIQPADNNPLKRYQDLVNSPATPDGHKVVAAVAAASTVTVAAVANWLIKATKK
ncbi:hypothetical protein [Hymenobacter sp. YC55]|uniref:hypothetical protein n=1 Tax=Hymenobacter sp. YC55 TaxID=3034019 RepID=UPI0023F7F3E7|nr:hypothetical protein [Hymenobacter sp. YC55]MDF7815408.1 hypothetical protein [Hymenobacter sp. YC55]